MNAGASSVVSTRPSRETRSNMRGVAVVEARRWRLCDSLVGATTAQLAARSVEPVLVLHRAVRRYDEALIAIDFRTDVARLLEVTRAVAPTARHLFVHGYQGPYETRLLLDGASLREMQLYLADVRREVQIALTRRIREAGGGIVGLRLVHGSARQVFLEEEEGRRGSNVLFVFERRGSVLGDLVFGSVTQAIIEEGRSNVLVV